MRIVFFGSANFGISCLDALAASDNDFVRIFTKPARPAGHHKTPQSTPVAIWAKKNNVPYTEAKNINSPKMVENIIDCKPDLLLVIAFGQKISSEVIGLFPKGAINVHASLVPKYRGAAPINWAIIKGETETGISIICVVDKMDAGDILSQAKIPINPDDTAQSIYNKLSIISPNVLLQQITNIANGSAVYTPQDTSKVTLAPKLKKTDGLVDWSHSAATIANKIRGMWPWPSAQAEYISKETEKRHHVIFANANPTEASTKTPEKFGMLDENLNVICGHGALEILKIKPAGSVLMPFKDFVNGRNLRQGDFFTGIKENA